jgi:hypothetical protein
MIATRIWLFGDYNQAESRVVAWRGPVAKLKQWYTEGKDVHLHVTHLIAKVIQESKLRLPIDTFVSKPWNEFVKGDEAREQVKRIVHGFNYLIGKKKMGLILGVPEGTADTLMTIYDRLFPDIRIRYHAWIQDQIKRTRTIWTPPPVAFRKVFWDQINDDTLRQGYASYPQIIVAGMLNRTLAHCATIFREDRDDKLKGQWCAWYGDTNWERWQYLRDANSRSPQAILWGGMDIRLNVHDAGGISIPDDPDLVHWAADTWRAKAEEPIQITKEDPLVIPVDFKTGKTWGDLKDYKL